MDKNKRELILLILLCTLLVNYLIYFFVVLPKFNKFQSKKYEFSNLQEKLNNLAELKIKKKELLEEIEKLKTETEGFEVLAPYNIDTPQLIYDFYNYCKKYNVIGDTIEFQLEEETSQSVDFKMKNVNENIIEDSEALQNNNLKTVITENQNKISFGVKKLDITLNVYSSKENLDEFIKNLNRITVRKLNIKNINIVSPEKSLNINNKNLFENIETDKHAKLIQDKMKVQIVFIQYIYYDGQNHKNINQYKFFDIKKGFNSIGDMFNTK